MEKLDAPWRKISHRRRSYGAASLDDLSESVIKAWGKVKKESVVKSLINVASQMQWMA